MEPELRSLVEMLLVEVGVRQAWVFATFASLEAPLHEVRLFIDTKFEVTTPDGLTSSFGDDDLDSAVRGLLGLLNLTVGSAVEGSSGLAVGFEGGAELRVSNAPRSWTTHDVWWLANPHALCQPGR